MLTDGIEPSTYRLQSGCNYRLCYTSYFKGGCSGFSTSYPCRIKKLSVPNARCLLPMGIEPMSIAWKAIILPLNQGSIWGCSVRPFHSVSAMKGEGYITGRDRTCDLLLRRQSRFHCVTVTCWVLLPSYMYRCGKGVGAEGGIRTHDSYPRELKSRALTNSATSADCVDFSTIYTLVPSLNSFYSNKNPKLFLVAPHFTHVLLHGCLLQRQRRNIWSQFA